LGTATVGLVSVRKLERDNRERGIVAVLAVVLSLVVVSTTDGCEPAEDGPGSQSCPGRAQRAGTSDEHHERVRRVTESV
jgi:hypothetical protein